MRINGQKVDNLSYQEILKKIRNLPVALSERTRQSLRYNFPPDSTAAKLYLEARSYLQYWKQTQDPKYLERQINCLEIADADLVELESHAPRKAVLHELAEAYFRTGQTQKALESCKEAFSLPVSYTKSEEMLLNGVYFFALSEEIGNQPSASQTAELNQISRYVRQLFNHLEDEPKSPNAQQVAQGEIGFSSKTPIGTTNINDCLCLILRNNSSKKTALAHIDASCDTLSLEPALKRLKLQPGTIEAKLIGARFFFNPSAPQAQQVSKYNTENIVSFLEKHNVNLIASDIHNSDFPRAVTVDPHDFSLSETVAETDPNSLYREGMPILASQTQPLKLAFDLDISANTLPTLLTSSDISTYYRDYQGLRLEYQKETFQKIYKSLHQTTAVIGSFTSLSQTLDEVLNDIESLIDQKVAKLQADGYEIDEFDHRASTRFFFRNGLYVGQGHKSFNQPIYDYIEDGLFKIHEGELDVDWHGFYEINLISPYEHLAKNDQKQRALPNKTAKTRPAIS